MDQLSAYIPMDRRQAMARGETLPDRSTGGALFADIAGFTPLMRAFVEELGPKRGAEALLGVINPLYGKLIGALHHYGGSVIGFAGDAITCWLDEDQGDAAGRAVASALAMQGAMRQFSIVQTPGGTPVTLSIKVAVAAGPARRFLVGDPVIKVIDTLAGATLERMAAAEQRAERGEVVISQEVVARLGDGVVVPEWRQDGKTKQRCAIISALTRPVQPTPWPALPEGALTEEQVRPWFLPAIYEQLRRGADVLGDLRPVTPLMLRFSGLDYDGDDAVGEKLDAFVRWVQRIIHRHGGSLVQLVIGDKGAFLYAPFGAPVAHEDDPARAMRAALALQQLPLELDYIEALQIGLTRGEVWTGTCGAIGRHTYGAMGSEVNLAARLMAQALPGQILVSGRVSQARGFDLRHIGDLLYKGFADPIPTDELLGEQLGAGRFFTETMVGRDRELQQLLDLVQPLFAGQLAGAVLLYGEAGIGKSHLSYALRQTLGEHVSWFTGQTDQILQEAFNPFVYWLKVYFEQSPEAGAAENRRRLESRLQELHDALADMEGATRIQEELLRTISFLGALLDLHWPDSLYAQLDDPKLRYQNTLFALVNLLQAESLRRPLVFELEDAHWLDASSQEVLTTLSRVLASQEDVTHPLLILITSRYRDDGSRPQFVLEERFPATTIDLKVLAGPALRRLAEDVLGGPVSDALQQVLQERSQANPFFAQQLLRYFQENALLAQVGDPPRWALPAVTTELPGSINAILVARIDRLAQEVQVVVKAAAVLGREFAVRLLAQVLRQDVTPAVQAGEQEQIWSALSKLRYIFKHALLRDAAYEMQLRAHLRDLHLLVAEAHEQFYRADLSPYYAELAYHYGQADRVIEERHYAHLAGEQAQETGELADAAAYFSRALDLTPPGDHAGHYDLLLAREKVYHLLGKRQTQMADLAELAALVGLDGEEAFLPDLEKQAVVALRRAAYAEATCDYEGAIAAAQTAIARAAAAGDRAAAAQGQRVWGWALLRQGKYDAAQAQLEAALAAQEAAGAAAEAARTQRLLGGVFYYRGDLAQTWALCQAALEGHRAAGDRVEEGAALNNLGTLARLAGDLAAARAYFDQALAIRRAAGDRQGEGNALGNLGVLAEEEGDLAAARATYEQALAIHRAVGDRWGEGVTLSNLGFLVQVEGDLAAARAIFEQALAIKRAVGDRQGEGVALLNLGNLAREEGELAVARATLEQALAFMRTVGDRRVEGVVLMNLGILAREEGDLAAARAAYEQALAIHSELGQPHHAAEDRAGLAAVALDLGDEAVARVEIGLVLAYLADNPTWDGAEDPDVAFLNTYQVLAALEHPQAVEVLETAYTRLAELAAKLPHDEARRVFWHNIPARRAILQTWEAQHAE